MTLLNLNFCPQIDAAAITILREMPGQREHFLTQTAVTDAALAEWQAPLPGIIIVR